MKETVKVRCICPYCEEELRADEFPFCRRCEVELKYCARCEMVVERDLERCPHCGGELEWR